MGYARILTTASKANTTGGTFADSLTANANDSLTVQQFTQGGARIVMLWAIDSDAVMEGELLYSRFDSVIDQTNGWRFQVPALTPGGAGNVGAHVVFDPPFQIPVFSGDSATIKVSSTAGDDCIVSLITEYDNLAGTEAVFADWPSVWSLRETTIGLNNLPVASGTPGAYGSTRALNADDTRAQADKYYAILGCTVQTQVTTIRLVSTTWGGQPIGIPAGVAQLDTSTWFVDQSIATGKPLIPVVNGTNFGTVLVSVADGEASTSPHIDWNLIQLKSKPAMIP